MQLRFLSASLLALAASACSGDKSLVALSATVESPSLSVERSSVGADAMGGFELVMALGEYASEATEVSLGSFSILRNEVELLSPLSLAGEDFPVSLGIGKKVTRPLTFDASPELGIADELCQGGLVLRGTLMDTLSNNHPTSVKSSSFSASCD